MEMTPQFEAQRLQGSDADPLAFNLRRRRFAFFSLVAASMAALVGALTTLFLVGGLSVIELAMIGLFAVNLPWITVGFWNAVVGFVLLAGPGWLRQVVPLAGLGQTPAPPSSRVAILMPVHDEDPQAVFRSLRATIASLDAAHASNDFEIFMLSDSGNPGIARREVALFRAWQRADRRPRRLHYRRRRDNEGFKVGNIRAFCERWGGAFDHMIVLDADSVMSGTAVLRLVGLMEANPRLGILQTLILGLPATSPFARIFQFGMRHGMRTYTIGSAWWQGCAGPFWGHNAIIRLQPFMEHCRLPRVPGRAPLGGQVLSHDQVEAVLMRKAGFEVRVLPVEDGSFEANPPTLPDFSKRDLRWCHGNMQYTRLLGIAGAHHMGRLQMVLAILMYAQAPCWLAFCALGLLQSVLAANGLPPLSLLAEPIGLPGPETQTAISLSLFAAVVGMTFAPKLFGLLHLLSSGRERGRFGGAGRVLAGAGIELVFSTLLTPVVSVAQTIFIGGLLFGRRLTWATQRRADRRLSIPEAGRALWPQTVIGTGLGASLLLMAPQALAWSAPVVAGLVLAIPFAVVTSSPRLGRWLLARRLCATPEELSPPDEVRAACRWLAALPAGKMARARPSAGGPMAGASVAAIDASPAS